MVSKPYVCENDETTKDTKAGDNEVEKCVWVLGELKSVLGYQKTFPALCHLELGSVFYYKDTLVSIKLPGTGVRTDKSCHPLYRAELSVEEKM